MNDLIALGYGWHELEGDYRWTQDKFSICILNRNIDSLFVTLRCNKLFVDYAIYASINDWNTTGKVNLTDGTNVMTVPLDKTSEVKFKCSSFIPSDLGASNDNRILGVQVVKFIVKCENNIIEIPISDVKLKEDVFVDSDYEINEYNQFITLKSGWHELEGNRQRWTNGNGEFLLKTNRYKTMKIRIFSKKNQILRIILDDFNEKIEKLYSGYNEICFDIDGSKKINFITDTFSPRDVEPYSKDSRQLGIMLTSVSVIGDLDSRDIPVKNIFFTHDAPQLLSFIQKYSFKNENIKSIGGFGDIIVNRLSDVPDGKLNLNDQLVFFSHRSGWSYVIDSLLPYHNKNGIRFEGFLEKPFIWGRKHLIETGVLPFKEPWIGVLHNPWTFPIENNEHVTSEDLVKSTTFQKSLETCKGLYVLSKDLMKSLKKEVNVPVNFFYHPTEFVGEEKMFNIDEFVENGEKKILEVGSWLRKSNSLFMLNSDKKIWNKIRVIPPLLNFEKMMNQIKLEREKFKLKVTKEMQDSVKHISPLPDDEYDAFFTKNVMFCDLYASSANNAIVECIARGTPILINKLPSIMEYLGKDYPFYFESIDEASEKINNLSLIEETNKYLLKNPVRECLKKDYFLKEFENSSIFRSLYE